MGLRVRAKGVAHQAHGRVRLGGGVGRELDDHGVLDEGEVLRVLQPYVYAYTYVMEPVTMGGGRVTVRWPYGEVGVACCTSTPWPWPSPSPSLSTLPNPNPDPDPDPDLVHVEARRLGGERRLAEAVRKVELHHRAVGLVQPPG